MTDPEKKESRSYSAAIEKKKRAMVKEMLGKMRPIAVVPFEGGVLAASYNSTPFRKIREVHSQIMIVASGLDSSINAVCDIMIDQVRQVESSLSARDVRLTLLIDSPGGVVGHMTQSFFASNYRPTEANFALLAFEDGKFHGVEINPCGERRYFSEATLVAKKNDGVAGCFSGDHISALARARDMLAVAGETGKRLEIGVLRLGADGMEHFFQEV
jgi:hypothetical protein